MNESFSFSDSLFLRSSTAGRERWQVKALRRKHFLAQALEQELLCSEHITSVNANPLTGRVLILFDPMCFKNGVGGLIIDVLTRITASYGGNDQCVTDEHDAVADEDSFGSKTLFDLIRTVKGEKKIRVEAITLTALNAVFKIATPLMQGMIMACAIQGGFMFFSGMGFGVVRQMAILAVGYYSSATLEKYIEFQRKKKWTSYSILVEASLRQRAYQHIHSLSLTTITEQQWGVSELARFVKEDSDRVKRFIEFSAPNMLEKGLVFSGCSALLLVVSPVSFLLAVIPIPFMYRLTKKFNNDSQKLYKEVERNEQELNRSITNSLNGLPTVKSYTAEDWEQHRLKEVNSVFQASHDKAASKRSKYHSIIESGIYLSISMPIIYSSYKTYQQQMSFTAFTSIAFLLPRMILSTQGLDQDYSHYLAAKYSAQRVKRLFSCVPDHSSGDPLDLSNVKG